MNRAGLGLLLLAVCMPLQVTSLGKDSIGLLKPVDELAITSSLTNRGVFADYSFAFIPSNTIPVGGLVQVTFPQQYASGLGLTATPSCVPTTCTASGYIVSFTLTTACVYGSVCVLQVNSLLNPSTAGGTGPFQLVSSINSYILDMNLHFGVIGIEQSAGSLTSTSVSVASGQSSYAGESTQYDFIFTVNKWTPKYSWMRFTFPNDDYTIPGFPSCTPLTINRYKLPGLLSCITTGRKVMLTGFTDNLNPGTALGIRIGVSNPAKAITTGTFTIETGRNSTNTVYEQQASIPGVTIAAGRVTGISLTPVDSTMTQSTKNIMRYTLLFTFTNPIEQGGTIVITCNNNFNLQGGLGITNLFWVNSGLLDISSFQTVTSVYSSVSNQLTISNFQAYKAGEISLMLELTHPATSGTTLPLGVQSMKADGTTIIDQDLVTAVTTISIITSPAIVVDFIPTTVDDNRRAGAALTIKFTLTPNFQIPGLGYITVKFPSSFSVTTPTCTMKPKNIGEDSTTCTVTSGVVSLQLKSTTAAVPTGSGSFLVGVDSYITIAGITASSIAGKYSMELQTFDQNNNLLESGNALVTTVASLFTAPVWNSVHHAINTKTILTFAFTPTNAIPSGATPATPSTIAQGFLEIIFPTQTAGASDLFAVDLSLGIAVGGTVPCLGISGISPASGFTALTCVLTVKPAIKSPTNTVTVTVSNFAPISAGTAVVLHIAGVTHVGTANNPSITLTSYQLLNRVRTDLNTKSDILATVPASAFVSQGTVATAFTSSSTLVSSTTTLANSFTPAVALSIPASFLIILTSHGNGYCAATTGLACSVGGTVYTCYCYAGADMIYVKTTITISTVLTTFSLANLVNPSSVPTSADSFTIYAISINSFVRSVPFPTLPLQTSGSFTTPIVSPSLKGLSYVNVQLSFTITPQHDIPATGTLGITLPGMFSLLSSSPVPVCTLGQFTALSGTAATCVLSGSSATVGNFKTVGAGSTVNVVISGVKHPSSGVSTGFFTFTSYTSLNLIIDQHASVPGYSFTATYIPGAIGIHSFACYPNNGKAIAEYIITFSVSNPIPAGGSISLTFPISNFGTLPSPPDCRINGSATYFQSCTTAGSIVTIVLSTSLPSTAVSVSLFNVPNFNQGTSNPFAISTMYDGLVLDQTTSLASASLSLTTSATAQPLQVNSITADPLNEGEMSTYTFSVTPASNIATSQSFIVTFPSTYDRNISDYLACWATGWTGYVSCTVTAGWQLAFTSTEGFTACKTCSISLIVYGVTNPQRLIGSNSGQFKVGTYAAPSYTEYNEAAGVLTFLAAPSYNNLYSITVSNGNARDVNDWVLNMTMTQTIPQTNYKGAIWVQFPTDYSLIAAEVNCESSPFWAGGVPDCTVYNNRILLNGQVTDFVGNLLIYLYNVPNPLTEMIASSITAKTYDGLNFKVLDSSYANTSPTRVRYAYPGPLIIVNNDQMIYVERGTVSGEIPVQLSYPAALNLTLVPQADDFTFMPYTVNINMGDLRNSFRIAVHESVPATAYVMTWATQGDTIPAFYTPVQASLVMVTQRRDVLVGIAPVQDVPTGGRSLPTAITLQYAPDVDITVSIGVSGLEGISVSPSALTFSAGVRSGFYTVYTTANVTSIGIGLVSYSVTGTNVLSYRLPFPSQPFTVGPDDGKLPSISGATMEGLSRTTVTIRPQASKPGVIYYMCALYGTEQPDFYNVKAAGPSAYLTTRNVYGNATVDSSLNATITLTGLVAQTPYMLFMYMEDLLDRPNAGCFYYNFTTRNRYATAHTQLRFSQSYLDEMDVENIVESVGLLLSLDKRRVLTSATITKARRTASVAKTAYLDLYIIDNPNTDNYPMPIDLLARLSSSISALKALLPTLDTSWNLPIEGFSTPPCSFQTRPSTTGYSSFNAISFLAALQRDGEIYAIAVNSSISTSVPTSQQISQFLDGQNRPAYGVILSVRGEQLVNSTILGLAPNTDYNLYVTCGNVDPGYPMLLGENGVVQMSVTTAQVPSRSSLNLNEAVCLAIVGVLWLY